MKKALCTCICLAFCLTAIGCSVAKDQSAGDSMQMEETGAKLNAESEALPEAAAREMREETIEEAISEVSTEVSEETTDEEMDMISDKEIKLGIQVGDNCLTASFEDNSSAKALIDELEKETITINMRDYGGFEKVGPLGVSLPTNDQQITTKPGDVILYQGNQLTIYYDTNSWSFTRIAKIDDASRERILEVLGNSDVTVVLSLAAK